VVAPCEVVRRSRGCQVLRCRVCRFACLHGLPGVSR